MFELKLENAKVFQNCVDALVTLIDEGEFDVSKDGVTLRAMDPSQIAMVDFELPKKAFEKYEVKEETKVGLSIDDLSRITGRTRAGESLTLSIDDSGSRLLLVFKGKGRRRFSLPLLDVSNTASKVPSIDFDASVKINGGHFKEALKDASLVSSYVTLKLDSKGFEIIAKGDKGDVSIELEKDDEVIAEHKVSKEARAMFPLEYLNDLLKSVDSSSVVSINLKTDAPLKLEYGIGEARVTYYLAPRIETA